MELILRLSAKHSNNKQTPRRLANLSGYFLEDSWVLFLPGWGNNSSRNSCSACLPPVLRQPKIFCNFVQQAPSTQACQGAAPLVPCSAPLVCYGEAGHLHQTLSVSSSNKAGRGRPYFHLEAEGFSCIPPQTQNAPWRGCSGY